MQIICPSPFIAQVFESAATVQVETWPELPAIKKFVWQNASLKRAEFHFLFPLRRQNVLQWESHGARVGGRLQAVWQQPPQLLQAGAKMRLQMTSWSHGGHLFYYFYYYCFFVSWCLPLPSSCWLAPGRLVLLLLLPRMSTMVLVAVILLAGHSLLLLLGDFPLGLLSTTSRIPCTRWFYILQGPFHALSKCFTECSQGPRHMPSVCVLPWKLASFNSTYL